MDKKSVERTEVVSAIEVENTGDSKDNVQPVRIIICGGRHFNDYERLEAVMNEIVEEYNLSLKDIEIVSGHCEGADRLGELWASKHGAKCTKFPAEWGKYGRAAGPIRNTNIVEYVAQSRQPIVVAFVNERTKGTLDTVRKAQKKEFKVVINTY